MAAELEYKTSMIGDLVTAPEWQIDRPAEIKTAGEQCSTGSNWVVSEGKSTKWTAAENKLFENALAVFGENLQDRWLKVASEIPGKTVADVIAHYKELEADVTNIEAGLIPVPGYSSSQFSLDWLSKHGDEGFRQSYSVGGRKSSSARAPEQERKKGVPWTEEEHKLFLLGLKKYGKGDWRNISRNFVVTRTPTQVASHAQKYFLRQLSGGKDKRRSSIHDITTVNINDARSPSPEEKKPQPVEYSGMKNHQPNSGVWNLHNNGETSLGYNQGHGIMFLPSSFGFNGSYGLGSQSLNGAQGMIFQSYPRRP